MKLYTGKFLQVIIVFCSCAILYAQDPCISYEQEMDVFYDANNDIDRAIEIYEKYTALDCADMLLAYNFIGFAYYDKSNFIKAKEFLILGENNFAENGKNPEQFAINQMYTGLIYVALRDFESAQYHFEKAEKEIGLVKKKFVKATIYQNIGLVKVETDKLDEAENYFEKAVETKGLDTFSIGYIYQNLAFLNLKRGNEEKAQKFIDRTCKIWNEYKYSKGIYLLSFIQAKLAINQKDYSSALTYIEEGRSAYNEVDRLLSGENYLIEAQIHDNLNNKKAKLKALENAILKSDDLNKLQLDETISDLSNLQDAENTNLILAGLISKLKTQNLEYKKIDLKRNRIMDSESDRDQSTINSQIKYLMLLFSLLLLLLYFFLRMNKQKKDIQFLNTNLTTSKTEIEKQIEVLQQKNKELEQFAYVASHDLKSPLRTISTFAGLLKKKYGSEDEYLDLIIKSSQNLSSMISELLRYSTLDQELNLESVNLNTLIQDATQRLRSQISDSNTIIEIDDSCNRNIDCDKSLFVNVLQNLISNSITYCKEDLAPIISISARSKNDKIIIKLTDNGIGMEQAHIDSIFEMFTRLKTKNVAGTGIGLSTCKKIIENHNGSITAESTFGSGSTFIITLPSNQ